MRHSFNEEISACLNRLHNGVRGDRGTWLYVQGYAVSAEFEKTFYDGKVRKCFISAMKINLSIQEFSAQEWLVVQ